MNVDCDSQVVKRYHLDRILYRVIVVHLGLILWCVDEAIEILDS